MSTAAPREALCSYALVVAGRWGRDAGEAWRFRGGLAELETMARDQQDCSPEVDGSTRKVSVLRPPAWK